MSSTKKWITTGVIMLAAGALLCGISFTALGFNFGGLDKVKFETNTYEVKDDFRNITIKANTEDIKFTPSEDGACKVVCYEEEDDPHQVNVQGDTLTIDRKEKNKWHLFSIKTETPWITVYLPNDKYNTLSIDADTGDVDIPEDFSFDDITLSLDTGDINCRAKAAGDANIKTDTGDITVHGLSADSMKLISDTGRIDIADVNLLGDMDIRESSGEVFMENVTGRNFTSNGSTGDLTMKNVVVTGEFNLERDTGDIEWNGCDAETIYVKTDTGDITGTLLSDKVYITETDTGSVDVPKTTTGGRCEITTDTGDIRISVK
ncbi:MAG: DUF4097 family beta strand repeat protein [Blautia sp.]|nr:DUF4097 family beta strand repeat protein [Blautia sp.]